jgi:hypothetical protein
MVTQRDVVQMKTEVLDPLRQDPLKQLWERISRACLTEAEAAADPHIQELIARYNELERPLIKKFLHIRSQIGRRLHARIRLRGPRDDARIAVSVFSRKLFPFRVDVDFHESRLYTTNTNCRCDPRVVEYPEGWVLTHQLMPGEATAESKYYPQYIGGSHGRVAVRTWHDRRARAA